MDINNLEVYKKLKEYLNFFEFFKEAINNAKEPMILTTPELEKPGPVIVFANEEMCKRTGYSFEELVGQTPRVLQGDKTNPEIILQLKKELIEQKVFSCETINYKKDKTPYKVRIVVCPLYDSKGQLINYVGIHQILEEMN